MKFSWNLAKFTGALKIFPNLAEHHGIIYDIEQENIHGKREEKNKYDIMNAIHWE